MNGIAPEVWGPSAWLFMSCVARNYPETNPTEKEVQKNIEWIESLECILPCSCKNNFHKTLKKLKWSTKKYQYLKNRDSYSHFIHLLHNTINKELGKAEQPFAAFLSVDQYRISCNPDACEPARHPKWESQISIQPSTMEKRPPITSNTRKTTFKKSTVNKKVKKSSSAKKKVRTKRTESK